MSLSLQRKSEEDIEIAHIISREGIKTVYLSEVKSVTPEYREDIRIDSSIANLFIGKTIEEVNESFKKLRFNLDKNCDIFVGRNEIVSIIPSPKPELVYITGQKGWGKSSLAARYAQEYHNKFPDNMIYLFTRMADDIAYNGVQCEEIVVNEEVLESGLVFENL